MRKRILSLFCAGALLFTACGQSAATTQTAAESTAAGATEVTTESVESTADVSGNTADTSSNTGDTSDNTAGKENAIICGVFFYYRSHEIYCILCLGSHG